MKSPANRLWALIVLDPHLWLPRKPSTRCYILPNLIPAGSKKKSSRLRLSDEREMMMSRFFVVNSLLGEASWRITPVIKWLVTHIYTPFRTFGRGTTMFMNHLLTGMILQVVGLPEMHKIRAWRNRHENSLK